MSKVPNNSQKSSSICWQRGVLGWLDALIREIVMTTIASIYISFRRDLSRPILWPMLQ